MTVVTDTFDWTDEVGGVTASTLLLDVASATPEPTRWHRCPDCGRLEHTDSELPGACVFCPGLVELEPA